MGFLPDPTAVSLCSLKVALDLLLVFVSALDLQAELMIRTT
jgi:hypothetical protein